jgi:tetratricopeptide (TPR) repeat protein
VAAADDRDQRARARFEAGDGLFKIGNYQDAIREFAAGYALSPRPAFLINLAQAYRKLDNPAKARELLQRFLVEAPRNDPQRPRVVALIADLDRAIVTAPPPVEPVRAAPIVTVSATPPGEPRPASRRVGLWVGISAAIVVVAGAVALALALTPRDPTPTGGMFTFTR